MIKLSEQIPPDALKNGNVLGLSKVMDDLYAKEEEQLLVYENMLNPYTAKSDTSVRDFLFAVGQLPRFTDVPMWLVEKFYLGARDMFESKGSYEGLVLFAQNALDGVIENADFSGIRTQEYFRPDNFDWGYLPDADDVAIAVDTPDRFPFLFGGAFELYYGKVSFDLKSDYINNAVTRLEVARFVVEMLYMCHPDTTNIRINFYTKTTNTFLETINL